MKLRQVASNLYALPLGNVNAFVLVTDRDGLVLIDTGAPGKAEVILESIQSLGYSSTDLKSVILTHCHPDHVGSAGALKRLVPHACFYMSEIEAPIVEEGRKPRPLAASPGLMNKLLFAALVRDTPVEPVTIDRKLKDGETLDFAGGIKTILIPGHSEGQLALLLPQHGGVLFAADAAANVMGLNWSIGYENLQLGIRSLQELGKLEFEIACFGHGKEIKNAAASKFRSKWPS
ncbi:beta-lactamase domain protein [Paenibacillus curdlanolyticus YK9]|uniref:Beta-lactamase domain protein n=1 Tax=Paenibacillus curdlanolyticus YK9 TaxID=717606 RepID=E0I4P1_9BACL|nr:MBL fold metallo-hydrolase [Paenibacillus curdlanolyticus]EFM12572.1 beta-lactamase domain protein [Paenibacillus curdlanolyticus YK9]